MLSNAPAGKWTSLKPSLSPWVLDTVASMGFGQMTPVQANTIPHFMQHKDVVVEATTGSGKSLAFLIPVIEKLTRRSVNLTKSQIGAIVICPTRELAQQIHSVLSIFIESQPSTSKNRLEEPLLLIGGTSSLSNDIARFKKHGGSIIVATPGRLEEFLLGSSSISKNKKITSQPSKVLSGANVKELEVLVLDEADRLLDLGFETSLTRIITHLPKQRRTGLFSATMTDALDKLVRTGLRNPVRVVVKVESQKNTNASNSSTTDMSTTSDRRIPSTLKNFYITCKSHQKLAQLIRIIDTQSSSNESPCKKFIVFFATCACVDYFHKLFSNLPRLKQYSWFSLHGQQAPTRRTSTYNAFSSLPPTQTGILLCTDVAARGIDLPDVDCVIQVDPPQDPKAFSHRCGRTARAGRHGKAFVLLVEGREEDYVDLLQVRKIPIVKKKYLQATNINNQDGDNNSAGDEDHDATLLSEELRTLVKTDRALNDLGARAFVSFIQSYSKHEASYIFRTKDLDLVSLASSRGLLKMPRLPEIRGKPGDGKSFVEEDFNWDSYAYLDHKREEARLIRVSTANDKEQRPSQSNEAKGNTVNTKSSSNPAWSKQMDQRARREQRRLKKERKRDFINRVQQNEFELEQKKKQKEQRDSDNKREKSDEHDDEEMAREEKMARKLKKGKISKAEFDMEFDE